MATFPVLFWAPPPKKFSIHLQKFVASFYDFLRMRRWKTFLVVARRTSLVRLPSIKRLLCHTVAQLAAAFSMAKLFLN
jgi:hypothetical protein